MIMHPSGSLRYNQSKNNIDTGEGGEGEIKLFNYFIKFHKFQYIMSTDCLQKKIDINWLLVDKSDFFIRINLKFYTILIKTFPYINWSNYSKRKPDYKYNRLWMISRSGKQALKTKGIRKSIKGYIRKSFPRGLEDLCNISSLSSLLRNHLYPKCICLLDEKIHAYWLRIKNNNKKGKSVVGI